MVETKSVGDQIHEYQELLRGIEKKGTKFSEDFKVSCLIDKLSPSWNEYAKSLRHKQGEFTLRQAMNSLRIEEKQRRRNRPPPRLIHQFVNREFATTSPPQTIRPSNGSDNSLSIEELIESCDPIPTELALARPTQSDTAAILYSSGTTGTSKGVVLTHANFIAIMTLLKWSVDQTSAQDDVFLCFIPMFHIYGLAFFALGMFCSGSTTVLMQKFEFKAMLDAIQTHKVSNIPAVPPVILALVKYAKQARCDLSSLRRISSGAAPLSKEVVDEFRQKFPWVELRPGYGLTESCGATTFFISDEEAKKHTGSCGHLVPKFAAKVVDIETGQALGPYKEGELWLKSPTIMKEYLGNVEATIATIDEEGWLKTGDLCYFSKGLRLTPQGLRLGEALAP
ncbi:hypothetical protein ACLB2K_045104 [Fragaria x ananassa]